MSYHPKRAIARVVNRQFTNFSLYLAMAAIGLASLLLVQAQAEDDNFPSIDLTNVIAHVEIDLRDDVSGIDYQIIPGSNKDYTLRIDARDGALSIDGPTRPSRREFNRKTRGIGPRESRVAKYLAKYPTVKITAPTGTEITLKNFVAPLTITGNAGDVALLDSIYLSGSMNDMGNAIIEMKGGGNFVGGNSRGDMKASISGSGNLEFGDAKSLSASIAGSGNMALGDIDGPATASVAGSGTIRIGDMDGPMLFTISGSGDIHGGKGKALVASISGSGDIDVAGMKGGLVAKIAGSGDITAKSGYATSLKVKISGSGTARLAGIAKNPDISISGSGDVYLDSYEGNLILHGKKDSLHLRDR